MKKILALLLSFVLLFGVFGMVTGLDASADARRFAYTYSSVKSKKTHESQLVVQYKEGSENRTSVVLNSKNVLAVEKASETFDVIECTSPAEADLLKADLEKRDDIEFVDKNAVFRFCAEPNDSYYSDQWYYETVKADESWDTAPKSKAVVVAVIDTGLDTTHDDLTGRFLTGYDVIKKTSKMSDANFHGTAVSGVLSAAANNSKGIVGIAGKRNIKVVPYRVAVPNDKNLYLDDINLAIERAIKDKVDVINMSLGSNYFSQSMNALLQKAHNNGITLIAAAGNGWEYAPGKYDYRCYQYPASYANVISVAATDWNDDCASFSQYNDRVDLCAPGVSIITTVPKSYSSLRYAALDGTSFSSPIVAAAAAILISENPGATPGGIEKLLKATATDLGAKGRDNYYGSGLLNIQKALDKMYPSSITAKNFTAPVGYAVKVPTTVSPSYALNSGFSYSSSDKSIATVSSAGKVTGVKPGKVTITVKSKNGKSAKSTITVIESLSMRVNYQKTMVNGKKTSMPDGKPQLVNGRTMIPMRYVFTALGCTVKFTANNKPIIVSYKDKMVSCQIGSSSMTVTDKNGNTKTIKLDSPPLLISGRTYLPIRAIGESLGFGVFYDASSKVIMITNPKQSNSFCTSYLLSPAKSYIK